MLEETFGSRKPIIGMAHFRPLPGSPRYDAKGGVEAIVEAAAADIEELQAGGIDAVMFGNEGDRPYLLKATPESLAAMASAVAALKPMIKVPFGVDYLWDPVATVALGVATGARFPLHRGRKRRVAQLETPGNEGGKSTARNLG